MLHVRWTVVQPGIALIHSPLVGPLSWSPVMQVLRQIGFDAVTPPLSDVDGGNEPYWKQHADSVGRALRDVPAGRPQVLVGHSGAGPLLPAIGTSIAHDVAAYIFVDAGLPHPTLSRLDEMEITIPGFGRDLRRYLEAGGRFPEWTDDDLREIVPDDRIRHALLADLRPRQLGFFEERLPAVAEWPDAPCGYIRLSAGYAAPAAQARARGWPYREFDAGHFHMLVAPESVAGAIVDLVRSPSVSGDAFAGPGSAAQLRTGPDA